MAISGAPLHALAVPCFPLSWVLLLLHVRIYCDASRVNLKDSGVHVEEGSASTIRSTVGTWGAVSELDANISRETSIWKTCDDSVRGSVPRNSYFKSGMRLTMRCKCPVGTHMAAYQKLRTGVFVNPHLSYNPNHNYMSTADCDVWWRRFDPADMAGKKCKCDSNDNPIAPQITLDWMGKVGDNVALKDLTIPGTHDTMAFAFDRSWLSKAIGGRRETKNITGMTLTHEYNLMQQLEAGVRWLDLRLGLSGRSVITCHGPFKMNCDFSCVLRIVSEFLDKHPREVVFFMLKPECSPKGDWEQLAENAVHLVKQNLHVLRKRDLPADTTLSSSTQLGDIRGKMVVVHTEGWDKLPYFKEGAEAEDEGKQLSLLVLEGEPQALQNEYKLSAMQSKEKRVNGKVETVMDYLRMSAREQIDSIRVNYFSASGIADEVRETALKVNTATNENLGEQIPQFDEDKGYAFGACLLDGLPTAGPVMKLIRKLIERNQDVYLSLEQALSAL